MYRWTHHRDLAAIRASSISGTNRDALWLVAVGALLIAVSALFGGHLGGLTGRPVGRAGKPQDRLAYAVGFAGAVLVAVGSIIAAIKAFPPAWIACVTVLGAGVILWLVAAWRLVVDSRHALSDSQASIAAPHVSADSERLAACQWDLHRYERQSSWAWCLRHAFSSTGHARADAERALGQRPTAS